MLCVKKVSERVAGAVKLDVILEGKVENVRNMVSLARKRWSNRKGRHRRNATHGKETQTKEKDA